MTTGEKAQIFTEFLHAYVGLVRRGKELLRMAEGLNITNQMRANALPAMGGMDSQEADKCVFEKGAREDNIANGRTGLFRDITGSVDEGMSNLFASLQAYQCGTSGCKVVTLAEQLVV